MGKSNYPLATLLIFFLNLGTLLSSLACGDCTKPPPPPSNCPPPPHSLKSPPPRPPKVKPTPPPPVAKSPPPPPSKVKPTPPPPVAKPPPPPPSPPKVKPTPPPPVAKPPPPPPIPVANPPPPPTKQQTCPIDALKLGACVDVLGGLIHIGIGGDPKEKCCPLLAGLVDLDAAICLCTAIKVELPNLANLVVPIALNLLVGDCGKHLPQGFQCPA